MLETLRMPVLTYSQNEKIPETQFKCLKRLVGERGFEPPTPWSRTRCSTRLSHSPTRLVYANASLFYFAVVADGKLERLDFPIGLRARASWRQGGVILQGRNPFALESSLRILTLARSPVTARVAQ